MVNGIRLEITSEKRVWAQRRVIPTKGRLENVGIEGDILISQQ